MRKRDNRRRILLGVIAVVLALTMILSLTIAMVRADETAQEETVQEEAAQEETVQEETVQEETVQEETVQEKTVQEEAEAAAQLLPRGETMLKNAVYIDNIDVSNMTYSEAEQALNEHMENLKKDSIVLYAGPKTVRATAGEMGLDYVNKEVLDEALSIGKKGNVLKRFLAERQIREDGAIVLELDLTVDRDSVGKVISTRKSALNCDPSPNGMILNDNGTFSITPAKEGVKLDEAGSVDKITAYMDNDWHGGQGGVELAATVIPSEDTSEQLQSVQNLLGTATTEFSTEDVGRCTNIALAAGNINGTVLYPGEEFSALKAIGPTTPEKGFALGASYADDDIVETYGGGICQVSTTLYNAVLQAELEIVERHNHSMRIHYVPPAFDAAIAEETVDFRFRNSLDTPIYLASKVENGTITFWIYGKETRSSNRTIAYESRELSTREFGTVYRATDSLDFGVVLEYDGEDGMTAELWKLIYIDGEFDSEEKENVSIYDPTNHSYQVGMAGANDETRAAIQNACGAQSLDAIYSAIQNGSTVSSEEE